MADTLRAGDSLSKGQSINSNNGTYALTLQDDGNLVLSENGKAVWANGTNGSGTEKAILQDDGNFVTYNGDNQPTWASQTGGNSGARLTLQDDRNVVVYGSGDNVLWSSDTAVEAPAAPAEPAPAPAEAPAPPPPPAAPAGQSYTVESGDTLWAIAERFLGDGNRYQEIANANGIANPDLINPGQVLNIPG